MSSIQCYEPKEKAETLTPMTNKLEIIAEGETVSLKDDFGFNVQIKKEELLKSIS